MKLYFERPVIVGFVITVVVLVLLGWYSFFSMQRLISTSRLFTHELTLIRNADLVLKSAVDMETAQRGYVITGNDDYLEPLNTSAVPLDGYLAQLDSLTTNSELQTRRLDTLRLLIKDQREWITGVIETRRLSFERARDMISAGQGKRIMDDIRLVIKEIQDEERLTFVRENTLSANSLQRFQISFSGLSVAVVLIIIVLFYMVNKTLKERNEVEFERRQNEKTILQLNLDLEEKVRDRTLKMTQSEKIYKSLAANIPGSAITILDRQEEYMLAEGDLLKKMGYEKQIMPGRKISDIITAENYVFYKTLIDRAFGGETILMEKRTLSGFDTLLRVVPLRNEGDDIFAIMFVYIDVTEMKATQLALRDLNDTLERKVIKRTEQLDAANKELEAFSYSVSHDLRSPLRAITGYSQILEEDYRPKLDLEGQKLIDSIIRNSNRMGQLIDDLLDFSRFGRKELSRHHVNMNDLVRDVVDELVSMEGSRVINVKQLPLEPAWADFSMIRQVWINLVSNALKYSRNRERTEIEIGSYLENECVCYYVRDNGAGFDMLYANKLYGVFQRLHKVHEFEGTGVGLALVKTIVKRHDGEVYAEGKTNEGAKFSFTLPIKK